MGQADSIVEERTTAWELADLERTSSKHSVGTPSSGGTPRTAWDVPCGTPSNREGQRRADPRCANADGLALHGGGQTSPRQELLRARCQTNEQRLTRRSVPSRNST